MNDQQNEIEIGAEAIAKSVFGGKISSRQVYRMAEEGGWPIFRVRGKLAARPVAMRAEIERREREGLERANGSS
jgi:hypothetical protein